MKSLNYGKERGQFWHDRVKGFIIQQLKYLAESEKSSEKTVFQNMWTCRRRINQLATNINGDIMLDCTNREIQITNPVALIIYLEQPMQYFSNIICEWTIQHGIYIAILMLLTTKIFYQISLEVSWSRSSEDR